jgi:hypothetical protein
MSKKLAIATGNTILEILIFIVGVEDRMLRRIFVPKREEITDNWVKHVVRMGEIRNHTTF